MTRDQIKRAILEVLGAVAPESDLERLKPGRPLRDQLDIDSYDFLNVMIQLHQRLGIDIPEADYQQLATLDAAVDYLCARIGAAP